MRNRINDLAPSVHGEQTFAEYLAALYRYPQVEDFFHVRTLRMSLWRAPGRNIQATASPRCSNRQALGACHQLRGGRSATTRGLRLRLPRPAKGGRGSESHCQWPGILAPA